MQRFCGTHLAESILAEVDYVGGVGVVVWLRASSRYGSQAVDRALAILNFETHTISSSGKSARTTLPAEEGTTWAEA
jgi:hypothetical protein